MIVSKSIDVRNGVDLRKGWPDLVTGILGRMKASITNAPPAPCLNGRSRGGCNHHFRHRGMGPPLTTYTPTEISAMAPQSTADGHSPSSGMAIRAVIAGHEAANAAPLEAPRILTA